MISCTGILLIGLCLPVPGMSEATVHEAGWRLTNDQPQSTDRYGSLWVQWNQLTLLVSVSVEGGRVLDVLISENRNRSAVNTEWWLKTHCRPARGNWSCRAGSLQFAATRCVGGWALVPQNRLYGDGGMVETCDRLRGAFEKL
jgi:hypothetical protein